MGIFSKIWGKLTDKSPQSNSTEPRYDNVVVINLGDGTRIKGHDAVTAYFKKEQELEEKHGLTIIFEIYRVNLNAAKLDQIQSLLAEIKVPADFATGRDTVANVKSKLRPLIEQKLKSVENPQTDKKLTVNEQDQISFHFAGQHMLDGKLFYADHYMSLPVWVQVYLHPCDHDEVMAIVKRLGGTV